MAVVVSALVFLFGAPALLLWTARLIDRIGRPPVHVGAAYGRPPGEAWYYRPAQPLFDAPPQGQAGPVRVGTDGCVEPWYRRPSKPVFTRPAWLRRPTFGARRAG